MLQIANTVNVSITM